ncbi:MAG: ABC transporter substrate-binding protein, partial [Chloroflexota bacterium]
MKVVSSKTVSGSNSDNRKLAIQNPKWVGLALVITLTFALGGAVAQAQQPKKVPRIGYLDAASLSVTRTAAFRQGLRELGYVEGKNIMIEWKSADGKVRRLRALVAELVRLKVAVIVTGGATVTRTAKEATTTIPIVMAQDPDPIGNGLVASLARPGGNITGLSSLTADLSGKRLELLKEILPNLLHVAVLETSTNAGNTQQLRETELAARAFGIRLQILDVKGPNDIETAFHAATREHAEAVLVLSSPVTASQLAQIGERAAKSRLPAMYSRGEAVKVGGFASYGVSIPDLDRRAATYVDKILKGAKPADLPVEQPTKFEFIVNLKTAKQIGLTIPPNVLARADRVIR